jgi:hypothetical protein
MLFKFYYLKMVNIGQNMLFGEKSAWTKIASTVI